MQGLLVLATVLASSPSFAGSNACPFQGSGYVGTPVQQASCLLRKVQPGGTVGSVPAALPPFLAANVGRPVQLTKAQVDHFLRVERIADRDIGGPVTDPLSKTSGGVRATYFVIHDTSDDLGARAFPANINDRSNPINRLDQRSVSMTHVMINRLGDSRTGHPYSVVGVATKFEHRGGRGLFLHHELVQPRIKGGGFSFGAIGPNPGFTEPQLRRLAVLYVAASVRKGTWMIPGFHCVIDQGIPDGHDDPQNFDLGHWSQLIDEVVTEAAAASP